MEEILAIDPDIILMSNFDSFTPADLYENRLDGQDWSQVSAVLNHRVYKTPMGIYRWDAPGVETPLMMRWLAQLIQPEIFAEIDIEQDTRAFFQDYFGYSLTDEDLADLCRRCQCGQPVTQPRPWSKHPAGPAPFRFCFWDVWPRCSS